MANKDLLTCPLCQGHSQISRAELIDLLVSGNLQEEVESRLAELALTPEPAAVGAKPVRDFQREVHSWNPQLPIWRRSPKE